VMTDKATSGDRSAERDLEASSIGILGICLPLRVLGKILLSFDISVASIILQPLF
jgi:hypothetical protein